MWLEELPVEILLKICDSLNVEDLVLSLRPISDQLQSDIDNLALDKVSKTAITIDGRGVHNKSSHNKVLQTIRLLKKIGLAKKVFLQNFNLRPMQIPFSSNIVVLNVKDCCKFRVLDFESVVNKCHSLEQFSLDLIEDISCLSEYIDKSSTLREGLKRPLKSLMIRWRATLPGGSNVERSREFLSKFVRYSELELFVSIIAQRKYDNPSAACPRELGRENPIVYCTPTNSYCLPGLKRFVMNSREDQEGQNYNDMKIKSLVLHDPVLKVEDSEFMCVPRGDGTASIGELPFPIYKSLHLDHDKILYESISTIAMHYPELEILSVCDLLHCINFHDWDCLVDLTNLTSFSLHEHVRNKNCACGSKVAAFKDMWDGLSELLKNPNNQLKKISLPMVPMSAETTQKCLDYGAQSLKELRITGAIIDRPKRAADGARKYNYYVFEDQTPFLSLQNMTNLTRLELLELPTVETSWIGALKNCKCLKQLSLCWVGIYGSWNWRSALADFLDDPPALEDLKLKNDCLKITEEMFQKFPKTLLRLLISSKKRYDPTYINEKQVNQDAVMNPANLLQVCDILPKLRLLHIESGTSEFAALKINKAALEKKIGEKERLMRVILRKVFDGPAEDKLPERDDIFVQDFPELRRELPDILRASTPFTF